MELDISCDIVTSRLDRKTITHNWNRVYTQTDDPAKALFAFSKAKRKYINMSHLYAHITRDNVKNYVYFTLENDMWSKSYLWKKEINMLITMLNNSNYGLREKIIVNDSHTEYTDSSRNDEFRYFYPGMPNFNSFKTQRKRKVRKVSS